MTREEFIANPPEEVDIWLMENKPPHRGKIGAIPDFFGGPPTKGYRVANTVTPFETAHKNIVKYAFKEGKPVPPKVLADYPYLVKKANPSEAVKVPEGIRVIDFPKYLRPALLSELGKDVKFKIWDRIGGYFDQITNTIYYPKGDKETLIHELMHLIEHSSAIDGLSKSLIKAGYYKKGEIGKMLQWYLTSEDGFALANTEPKAWLIINNFLKRYSPTEVLRKNPQELKGLRELVGTEIAPKAKEPWQMTAKQFNEQQLQAELLIDTSSLPEYEKYNALRPNIDVGLTFTRPEWQEQKQKAITELNKKFPGKGDWLIRTHRELIQQALSESKPVPPEVLVDYPEIAPKAGGKGYLT